MSECPYSDLLCEFNPRTECQCIKNSLSTITCHCFLDSLCCNIGCSTCDIYNLCLTCIDSNAGVSQELKCIWGKGFYQSHPVSDSGICWPCNKGAQNAL